MPYIQCTFYSEVLGSPAPVNIVLPTQQGMNYRKKFPVLYLLHGLMDDGNSWYAKTALERYANQYQLAVVLPYAGRSFYCDMVYGNRYYTHVSQEVIDFCEAVFPLSTKSKEKYIAGNSMGGYGAVKIALRNPGKFSKVASLSGVMDINSMIAAFPEYEKDWQLCFENSRAKQEDDLFYLIEQSLKTKDIPELYQYCGTKDFLYQDNINFSNYCSSKNIPVLYSEEKDGIHEWDYWDIELAKVMQWLT